MLSLNRVRLCEPMDCSLLGSSIHGILQARILEWVFISSSRESSQPRDQTCVSYVSCISRRVLYHECHLGSCPGLSRETQFTPPGQNTGVGCHALLQGIFPTQGSNLRLLYVLHWPVGSLPSEDPAYSSLLRTWPCSSQPRFQGRMRAET